MEFKVFTLNCWGIPIVSKDRLFRIGHISAELASSQYDVVCLQEVWKKSDFDFIRKKIRSSLPYAHYFHSGVFGSGVCIFSKHPIINTHFHKWTINGYVHKIHHGDWFGGKGIGLAQISYNGLIINLYSAHLHAEYSRKNDEYYACRVVQAYDTAQFINLTAASGDVVILAGDLNCEPGDLTYKFMVEMTGLKDSYLLQNEENRTYTNLDLNNSYTPSENKKDDIDGSRIDYILFHSNEKVSVKLTNYKLPFPNFIPGTTISFSDHEAIEATLSISKRAGKGRQSHMDRDLLLEGIDVMEQGLRREGKKKIVYWILTVLLLALFVGSFFAHFAEGVVVLLHVMRFFLSMAAFYTFIMATIWNQIETNTLYSAQLAMKINLQEEKKINSQLD